MWQNEAQVHYVSPHLSWLMFLRYDYLLLSMRLTLQDISWIIYIIHYIYTYIIHYINENSHVVQIVTDTVTSKDININYS